MMEASVTGKVEAKGERMGSLGMPEMIGIFMIALLLFGPKKLPELGRTLGKALTEFRRAKNELKTTFETHMQELERETKIEPSKEFTPSTYSYPYDDYGRYEEPVTSAHDAHPAEPTHLVETSGHGYTTETPTGSQMTSDTSTPAPHTVPAPVVPGTVARSNGTQSSASNPSAASSAAIAGHEEHGS
jgi:sec-independent protein translocase protein TatA